MQLMVEGDKWEMYIPSELAYGESGSPPKIGGGDALIFQMELIKIKGKSVPAVRCDPKTLAGCSEQESTFIGKVGAWSPAQLQTESDRLGKMNVAHMKPELAAWISRRRTILGKLLAADSKQEL